ncbi:MAG: DHH family phosphoesterase [Phycisphaerales bacterium]|nr:DHH family phosphoesterase [Phycisphaerales bacterium]MCI0629147.1 DHH family phosphoesterase [Phycisphaerales bacterium]MCI0676715.1 DHH family phosphoesterase [Phycisphaerales bacterium]
MAQRILASQRPVVTTHTKPDGDAIGSTLALTRALAAKGKRPQLLLMGPIEASLKTIIGSTPFSLVEDSLPGDQDLELIVVADTGSWNQVEPIAAWLKKHHSNVIGIDHHSRGDSDVASMRLVDPKAVSTTMMLVPLLEAMKCPLTGGVDGVAEPLFVGLATDSGWFRYGNAGPDAFALAARLLQCGVDKSRLYQILEETYGPQRLSLEARALASLEYAKNGSVAIQMLKPGDFQAAGASLEDLTGLVNTPMTVGSVRVSILLAQHADGVTKISFRSKPAPPGAPASDFCDVNALAGRFGGGGHVHAAGARLKLSADEAKKKVLASLAQG